MNVRVMDPLTRFPPAILFDVTQLLALDFQNEIFQRDLRHGFQTHAYCLKPMVDDVPRHSQRDICRPYYRR